MWKRAEAPKAPDRGGFFKRHRNAITPDSSIRGAPENGAIGSTTKVWRVDKTTFAHFLEIEPFNKTFLAGYDSRQPPEGTELCHLELAEEWDARESGL